MTMNDKKNPAKYFRAEVNQQTENGRRLKTKIVKSKKIYTRKNRKPES
jgi:hypothetical protein